jgi:signal peptidase I
MMLRRWTFRVLLGFVAVLWFALLRPTSLGGPTSYVVVAGDSMLPTYGDGTLVVGFSRPAYEPGDVITFAVEVEDAPGRPLVIHRIVSGNAADGFTTKGDNRPFTDPWTVMPADIVGRDAFAIPGVGQALLIVRSPIVIASTSAAVMTYVVLGWMGTRTERRLRRIRESGQALDVPERGGVAVGVTRHQEEVSARPLH